jgi:hypothetical protein
MSLGILANVFVVNCVLLGISKLPKDAPGGAFPVLIALCCYMGICLLFFMIRIVNDNIRMVLFILQLICNIIISFWTIIVFYTVMISYRDFYKENYIKIYVLLWIDGIVSHVVLTVTLAVVLFLAFVEVSKKNETDIKAKGETKQVNIIELNIPLETQMSSSELNGYDIRNGLGDELNDANQINNVNETIGAY